MRLDSEEHVSRAGDARARRLAEAMPALSALALEADADGASLRFEVNLDQAAGETATAKKVLETLLAIPPSEQLALSITREATVLG